MRTDNNTVRAQWQQQQQQQQQQHLSSQGSPIAIIPGLTGNVLAIVSFLIGTSSFILGLKIQSAA
jgi:preprotein translocase subunit YajC